VVAAGRSSLRTATALCAVLAAGCHDVTEFESEGSSGVVLMDADDLSILGTMQGFDGGRSVASIGGDEFFVATNQGQIYRVDASEQAIVSVFTVGQPYSSGYTSMIPVGSGTVHLIGGYDQVVQVSNYGIVLDEFPAGTSPSGLCRTGDATRLFVCDGSDGMMREILLPGNEVVTYTDIGFPMTALASASDADSSFVAVGADTAAYISSNYGFIARHGLTLAGVASDVACLPDTALFCIAIPEFGESSGYIALTSYPTGYMVPSLMHVPLEGNPLCICTSDLIPLTFYVGARMGDGMSRIYEYTANTHQILGWVDIEGNIVDLTTISSGQCLAVLLAE